MESVKGKRATSNANIVISVTALEVHISQVWLWFMGVNWVSHINDIQNKSEIKNLI